MMYDWTEMATVVGRKLVENGQTRRILQRIYDGGTSDLILDVLDYKEKLLFFVGFDLLFLTEFDLQVS